MQIVLVRYYRGIARAPDLGLAQGWRKGGQLYRMKQVFSRAKKRTFLHPGPVKSG